MRRLKQNAAFILLLRVLTFVVAVFLWWALVQADILPRFFFSDPVSAGERIYVWVATGELFKHLGTTILEAVLAFLIGAVSGLVVGVWLALSPFLSVILSPYLAALNSMPRIILAPIFIMWFGIGIWSKVALAVTLVFFVVFFNAYNGIREVSPILLANGRMLGATRAQLLRYIYLPSATSWVFSSLHASVGMAFVGVVVGEYLASAKGIGFLILQAEGVFDIDSVIAGIIVVTACALVLGFLVDLVERRIVVWRPHTMNSEQV